MDRIYKTKWGIYIDLSRIVSMNQNPFPTSYDWGIQIQFQLCEKPNRYFTWGEDYMEDITADSFNDLLNAWKQYVESAKNEK